MKTIRELKKEAYDTTYKRFPYIFDEWKWYSYRRNKGRLYINVGVVLVYLLMRTKIKPNTITIIYILMGIFAGIFLAVPLKVCILLGIILFYFRGILDWSDGLLARETNQTSITGAILDNYGALTGWVALWVGFGFYIANKSEWNFIMYLIPLVPALFAMDIVRFARSVLFVDYNKSIDRIGNKEYNIEKQYPLISRIVRSVNQLFEHNARTVDFICIVIFIELFFPIFISWTIFLSFLAWQFVIFCGTFYMVARGGWVEDEVGLKCQ